MQTIAYRHLMSAIFRHKETAAEHAERLKREDVIIARAEADIDAGLGVNDKDLEAWLDELEHDRDAPAPAPRSTGSALS